MCACTMTIASSGVNRNKGVGLGETVGVGSAFGTPVPAPQAVKSSTIAQVNEVLCKLLCHNICVLISSIYELGLEPTFWVAENCEAERPVAPRLGVLAQL